MLLFQFYRTVKEDRNILFSAEKKISRNVQVQKYLRSSTELCCIQSKIVSDGNFWYL